MIDRCAKLADRGIERIAPTPKNIARLLAEKEEAFELAKQGMAATDDLRGKVDPRHMTGLRTSFLLMRELARVYRPELEALLRYFQWEATMSEVDRERLRVPILDAVERTRTAVSEAQANLSAVDARKLCEDLGMNWRAFKSNKGLYSQNRDVTRMDQNIALPYALSLVDDIEQHMQYVPASVFGYY